MPRQPLGSSPRAENGKRREEEFEEIE